jgi:HD-like signal output (HDOD) protein
METVRILEELEKIENLPTLPVVAQQIQKLIGNPNSNMAQIASIITKDQAIAARVIRLINSAFYGLGGRVTSIQQAIVLLGLNTVKNLVTGVAIVKMFEDSKGGPSLFNREMFWMHTFACALGARMIAINLHEERPEDFFLAGLLHDVGILVLDQYFHNDFIAVLKYSVCNKTDFLKAEQQVLGTSHGEIGEFLARKWKVPEYLSHAIRHHHAPSAVDRSKITCLAEIAVVHAADVASDNNGIGMLPATASKPYSDYALRHLNLTSAAIETMFEPITQEVKRTLAEWGI